MRKNSYLIVIVLLAFCYSSTASQEDVNDIIKNDTTTLIDMIKIREQAMINKDVDIAMSQFSDDITWINSQGYFFDGKKSVLEFHQMLVNNNTSDYLYEAGNPRIRIISANNAIVYYSWKMFWFDIGHSKKINKKEIGLMTLFAQKLQGKWYWIAVTNQHTPWFYQTINVETIH